MIDSERIPVPLVQMPLVNLGPAIEAVLSVYVSAGRETNPGIVVFGTQITFTDARSPAHLVITRRVDAKLIPDGSHAGAIRVEKIITAPDVV